MAPMFESGYSVFERSYCTVCDCLIDAKSEDSLYCSRACRKAEAKKTFSMPIEEVRSTFKRTKSATSLSGLVEHGEQPSTRLLKGHSQTASHSGTDDQRTPVMLRPLPPKRSSYGSSLPRSIDLVTPDPQLFSLTVIKQDKPKTRIATFELADSDLDNKGEPENRRS